MVDSQGNPVPKLFAMKICDKRKLYMMRSVESVKCEMNILSTIIHPLCLNMQYAFHDTKNVYMVSEYLKGGSLRYFMNKDNIVFTEKQTQFIIACLILALEFLHNNGVLHRDIRPENMVFDEQGFCKLCDFGGAREWKEYNMSDTSGHPGYIAPEVLNREKHGTAADYFAVGVVAHELMRAKRPWDGETRDAYKKAVMIE